MNDKLLQAGYYYDNANAIWRRPDFNGIDYSDGDEIEDRIERIVANASDIRVLSDELTQHITDWPSRYHLSGTRANILRPLEADLAVDVLEIGAGCGAITRFLGESGARVVAVEGSLRRARIARLRTRDLEQVDVVAERFDNFECDRKFDFVTLIGVFEYAGIFTSGSNPPLTMLERARSFLKPNGKLIIAIENKIGLKYLAGAPEDHVSVPFFGVEDRYRSGGVQTFGRRQLDQLLTEAGFAKVSFLAPFPDYKLPISIVSEQGFKCPPFDGSAFAWQTARGDHQFPKLTSFSIELVWPTIVENGLGLELANSFLVIAHRSNVEMEKGPPILAYHFSTNRKRQFCKETVFKEVSDGNVCVQCRRLAEDESPTSDVQTADRPLTWNVENEPVYVAGRPLSLQWVRAFTELNDNKDEQVRLLREYLGILAELANLSEEAIAEAPFKAILPGKLLDAIPSNLVRSDSGAISVIDLEWTWARSLSPAYMLFRALSNTFSLISALGHITQSSGETTTNFLEVIRNLMALVDIELTDGEMTSFLTVEKTLYEYANAGTYSLDLDALQRVALRPGDLPSKLFHEMPFQLAALADENSRLHVAKDYAEELAISRMQEITRLKISETSNAAAAAKRTLNVLTRLKTRLFGTRPK